MELIRPDSSYIQDFYNNGDNFKGFREIKDEESKALKKQAKEIKTYLETKHLPYMRMYGVYMDTIKYLLTLEEGGKISTDQKMFLFILLMDPRLEIYEVYLKKPIFSNVEIAKHLDKFEQNHMYQRNYRSQRNIEKVLMNVLGCFDEELIKYEIAYKNNVIWRNKINMEVKVDYAKDILKLSEGLANLDEISEERYPQLVGIAQKIKEEIRPLSTPVITHAILYQSNLLGIETRLEQVLLYLLIFDPNFHLIDIFEEESRYQQIEQRALNELGFYEKNLINIEKMMIEKFSAKKKETNWMLLKSTD